ncbi:(ABC) transporter, partial [Perkinsus olseni]
MQSDREMISFLERYGVKWQVIVTKCDLLKPRFLAKRLVIVQQILDTEFKGSIGPMIPLSALAKQGVDELRIVLNSFKLDKRTVVNGIEERLLDMREAKRVKRVEKRKKRLATRKERLALTRAADMVRSAVAGDTAEEKELNRTAASDALKKWGVAFEQQTWASQSPDSGLVSAAHQEATDLMRNMMGMLSEGEDEDESEEETLDGVVDEGPRESEPAVAKDLSTTAEALLCWEDDRDEVDTDEEDAAPHLEEQGAPSDESPRMNSHSRLPVLGPVVATAHHWNVGKGEDRLTTGSGADPVGHDWLRSMRSSREAGKATAAVMDFNVRAKSSTQRSVTPAFVIPEDEPEERISDDGFSKFPSRYLSREESEAPPVNA